MSTQTLLPADQRRPRGWSRSLWRLEVQASVDDVLYEAGLTEMPFKVVALGAGKASWRDHRSDDECQVVYLRHGRRFKCHRAAHWRAGSGHDLCDEHVRMLPGLCKVLGLRS